MVSRDGWSFFRVVFHPGFQCYNWTIMLMGTSRACSSKVKVQYTATTLSWWVGNVVLLAIAGRGFGDDKVVHKNDAVLAKNWNSHNNHTALTWSPSLSCSHPVWHHHQIIFSYPNLPFQLLTKTSCFFSLLFSHSQDLLVINKQSYDIVWAERGL